MACRDEITLTHRRLLDVLDYCPTTGLFSWRVTLSNRAQAGAPAGVPGRRNYATISIDGVSYRAHKLAIYWYSGIYPFEDVDHKDGDPRNNRLLNLRAAGARINVENRRGASKNNASGLLGVYQCKTTGRWRSSIRARGQVYRLGRFDTPEEAHQAYLEAKRKLHQGNTL